MSKKVNTKDYLLNNVKKPLESVVKNVLKKKPDDPIPLILSALEQLQGVSKVPLTLEERIELDALRNEHDKLLRKLRKLEGDEESEHHTEETKSVKTTKSKKKKHHDDDDDTESEEESDEILPPLPDNKKGLNRKPRTSVSAEAFGSWNKKGDFKAIIVPKNDETREAIRARLKKSFLFNTLDPKDFEIVIDAMAEVKLIPGQVVIKEGDDGDYLYVVEKGRLQCSKIFKGKTEPTNLIVYEPGGAFGELALLYNAPRAATITAIDEWLLWGLDRQTFNHIVKESAVKKREMYDDFLKKVKILATMDSYERQTVADAFIKHFFKKGDYVIREKEEGDVFYFIVEGEAIATKLIDGDIKKVMSYKAGDYFGERALLKKEPRAANIVATSESLEVVSLDKDCFNRLLGPLEDILKRNMEIYAKYNKID